MKLTLVILFSFFTFQSYAQADSSMLMKYTPEFEFQEGIYLDFSQVRNNNPLPKSRLVSETAYDDKEFFEKILNKKMFYYYDHIGNKIEVRSEKIWGYSRNGFLFISINDGFYRISMIGSICHFVAYHTQYNNYNSPYYYNSYMDPYRGSTINTTPTTEMRQYLMDFESGNIYEYEIKSLEVILMRDSELHDEYTSLSKKKKKQLKFFYIRKFNERNPLYFPSK